MVNWCVLSSTKGGITFPKENSCFLSVHRSQSPAETRMSRRAGTPFLFDFRSNLPGMRLPWECHDQSQETNWRHGITGPELPFISWKKGLLKIDQSLKMSWRRPRMGVACSYSTTPGRVFYWLGLGLEPVSRSLYLHQFLESTFSK